MLTQISFYEKITLKSDVTFFFFANLFNVCLDSLKNLYIILVSGIQYSG